MPTPESRQLQNHRHVLPTRWVALAGRVQFSDAGNGDQRGQGQVRAATDSVIIISSQETASFG